MSVIGKPLYSSNDLPNQSEPAQDESPAPTSNHGAQPENQDSSWPIGETFLNFFRGEKSRVAGFFTQLETLKDDLEDAAEARLFRAKIAGALQETASLPNYLERLQAYRRLAWGAKGGAEIYSVFQPWLGCLAMPGVETTRALEDLVGMAHLAAGEKDRPEIAKWMRRELKDAVVYFQDRLNRERNHLGTYQLLRAVRPVFGDEFEAPMQDAYQQLSEDELQRIDAPLATPEKISEARIEQLEKTVPTLLWLHQLIEGSFQQRIQEAETKSKPTAKLTQQRQMLRDYLASIHAYLRSGKAIGTKDAIEKLAADYGDRAPREFYRQLGKVFEYQIPMGDRIGISDHILQLVESEAIADPKIQAKIRLSLAKQFIVDDSLARRAEMGIAGMLQHLESFAASSGDRELQNEIGSLKKWKPYLQATNRVLDHTFSMEGFGISMASMFTAGLVGEIAALAAAMRMGVVTMESLSLGQKFAVGAVRFGANWAAFNASETALKSGFRLAHGDVLPSAKELKTQVVNSFFSLGGGHLAAMPFAHLKQIPLAGFGRFFAFSAGMVKGEDIAAAVQGLPTSQEPFLLRFYEASLNAAFLELGAKAGKPISEHLLNNYVADRRRGLGQEALPAIPIFEARETAGPAPARRVATPARGFFERVGKSIERALHPDAETHETWVIEREIDHALQSVEIRDSSGGGRVEKWFDSLVGMTPKDLFRNRLMEKFRMQEFNRDELKEILDALGTGRLTEYDVSFLDSKRGSAYQRQIEGALRKPMHRWLIAAARDPQFVEKVRHTALEIGATADYLSRGILRHPDRPTLQGLFAGEIRSVLETIIQLSRDTGASERLMGDLDYAAELAGALSRIGLDKLDDSFFHPLHGDLQRLHAIESTTDRRVALLQFVLHKAELAERRGPRHPLPQVFEPGDPHGPAYSRSKIEDKTAPEPLRAVVPNGEVWEIDLQPYEYKPEQNMPQRVVNVRHVELLDNGQRARLHLQGWNRAYTAELSFAAAEQLGVLKRFPNGENNVIFFGKEFAMHRRRILEGPLGEKGGQSLAEEFGFKDEAFLREVRKTASAGMRIEDARQAYAEILPAIEGLGLELRQAIFLQIARGEMSSSELQELKSNLTESKVRLSTSGDGLGFFRVSLTRPLTIDEVIALVREFEHADRTDLLPEPPARFGSDSDRTLAFHAIRPQLDKLPVTVKRLIVKLVTQGRLTQAVAKELSELIEADQLGIDLTDIQARSLGEIPQADSKLAVGVSIAGERYVLKPYDPAKDTYNPGVQYGVPSRGQIMNSIHGAPVEILFNTWQGSERAAGTLSLSLTYRDCVRLGIPLRPDGKLDARDPQKLPNFILIPETPPSEPDNGKWDKLGFGPTWRGIISFGAGIATLFTTDTVQAALGAAMPSQETSTLPAVFASVAIATLAMAASGNSRWLSHLNRWIQESLGLRTESNSEASQDSSIAQALNASAEHPYRTIGREPSIPLDVAVGSILQEASPISSNQSTLIHQILKHSQIASAEATVRAITESGIHSMLQVDYLASLGANRGLSSIEPLLSAMLNFRGEVQDSYLIMRVAELAKHPHFIEAERIVQATLSIPARPAVQVKALALIGSAHQIGNIEPLRRFIVDSDIDPVLKTRYLSILAGHPRYSDLNGLLREIQSMGANCNAEKAEAYGFAGAHPGVDNIRPILNAIAQSGASHNTQAWAVQHLLANPKLHQFTTIIIFLGSLRAYAEIMVEILTQIGNHPNITAIDPVVRAIRKLELSPSEKVEALTRLLGNAKLNDVDLILTTIEGLASPEELAKALGHYGSNPHIKAPASVLRRIQSLNVEASRKQEALALAGANPNISDLTPFLQLAEQSSHPERELWLGKMLQAHPQDQDLIFQSLRRIRRSRTDDTNHSGDGWLPAIGAGLAAFFASGQAHAALGNSLDAFRSGDMTGWLAAGALALGVIFGSRRGGPGPYRENAGIPPAEIDIATELNRLWDLPHASGGAHALAIARRFESAAIHETTPILTAILECTASPGEKTRAIGIFARNTHIHDFAPFHEALIDSGDSPAGRAAVLGFIASQLHVRDVDTFMRKIRESGATPNQIAYALADAGRNPNWRDVLPLAREIVASQADRNEKLLALGKLGQNPNLREYQALLEMIVSLSQNPFFTTGIVNQVMESADISDPHPFLRAIFQIGAAREIQAASLARLAANPSVRDINPILTALDATGSRDLQWDYLRLLYARPDTKSLVEAAFRRHSFDMGFLSQALQARTELRPDQNQVEETSLISQFAERAASGLVRWVDRWIPDPQPPAFLKFMDPTRLVQPTWSDENFGIRITADPSITSAANPADFYFEKIGAQWKVHVLTGELWVQRPDGTIKYHHPGSGNPLDIQDGDKILYWRPAAAPSVLRTQASLLFVDPHRKTE